MLNLGQVVSAVQNNCNISDAKFAGNYSMCSFLLKMREYYRWEHELPLSSVLPKDEIGHWLVEREQSWQALESDAYRPLPLEHSAPDPFDAQAVNDELLPHGYVYSSGYGIFNKPHFFVGRLARSERRAGVTIHVSACEYARDLVAPPAMMREETAYVRQEPLRRFIWEKIEEWRWQKKPDSPMARALDCYGGDADPERVLDHMTENETETMILHELGEVAAGRLLGPDWEEMLSGLAGTQAEFVVRAVRDHLADALTTFPALLDEPNEGGLHFYFANLSGVRRALYPEAVEAYKRWIADDSLHPLRELCAGAAARWQEDASALLAIFRDDGPDPAEVIETRYRPLLSR